MKNHNTIGDYYAYVLEKHLNAAIQKKLDDTSGFKKKLAGIETIHDAKAKGYAPSNAQILQIKTYVIKHTNNKYPHVEVQELVAALTAEIAKLNEEWRKNREFSFDKTALTDLAKEAATLIASEHEATKKHFFR